MLYYLVTLPNEYPKDNSSIKLGAKLGSLLLIELTAVAVAYRKLILIGVTAIFNYKRKGPLIRLRIIGIKD